MKRTWTIIGVADVEDVGIVRFVSADEAEFHKPGGSVFLTPKFLADGPGLLAPDGFPNARTR